MEHKYNLTVTEFVRLYSDKLNEKIYGPLGIKQMYYIEDNLSNSLLGVEAFVVSTHRSKSCNIPVYAMMLENGIKIIMRNNFHDWVLTIMSPKEISIPNDLVYGLHVDGNLTPNYCEGFKEEWVFDYKTENFKNTTVYVSDDLRLFTLLYLLNKEDIGVNEKVSEIALKSLNFESIKTIMKTYMERHKSISLFHELFPKTYRKLTDYNFCENNNLSIFLKDDEEVYKRISEFDELKRYFLIEKNSFDWGENLEPYKERLNF